MIFIMNDQSYIHNDGRLMHKEVLSCQIYLVVDIPQHVRCYRVRDDYLLDKYTYSCRSMKKKAQVGYHCQQKTK